MIQDSYTSQEKAFLRKNIEKILQDAVNAPSGDNSQPWRFVVRDNTISLWNIPGVDATPYNFKERGSFVGHGAVIENISLLAPTLGYQTLVALFPKSNNNDHVADIALTESASKKESLAEYIVQRVTNRKAYDGRPLTDEQRESILNAGNRFGGAQFGLIEDRDLIQSLARTVSLNERLILENREIHDKLFATIRWTAEEEREHLHGMYIKTLELAPPQEKAFKFFRKWGALSFLSKIIPIPKLVSNDSRKLYAAASAFGLISIPSESNVDFILAGRMLQRIWLTVTSLGLSMQPTAALLYLAQRVHGADADILSQQQQADIRKAELEIREIFGSKGIPAMLFRIGNASEPTARSMKRSPEIRLES